jgi:pimeloyl-ACP methyl ester carboxylesterase
MTTVAAHYTRTSSSRTLQRAALRWLLRGLLGLLVTLAMLAGVGAIYQAMATETDMRTFPPPGQLIDVGGYHLHLQCAGQGSPTVVLETGLGGWSTHWALIQPTLAQQTRVCSYDRAGLGWSDPGPQPRDAQQIASELRTLLRNAGVPAPFLLAGHSNGGLYARMFARRYGDEVAGLVLADPTAPELFERLPAARADLSNVEQQARVFQVLAPVGLVRLLVPGPLAAELSAYPARARDDIVALNSVGRQWHGLEAEVEGLPASMA